MEIYSLNDDVNNNASLDNEHGLSFFIKIGANNILFDFGASDIPFLNAERLKLNISDVDFAVLSHSHYDHCGGIDTFLNRNKSAKIYVSNNAFEKTFSKKNGFYNYIGLNRSFEESPRIIPVKNSYEIAKRIRILSETKGDFPSAKANGNLYISHCEKIECKNYPIENNEIYFRKDKFTHEQHLIMGENNKYFLVTGCSHGGIINIMNSFYRTYGKYPDYVIGGFHLQNPATGVAESDSYIKNVGDFFKRSGSMFITCHCTGYDVYKKLKTVLKDKINYLSCGEHISF